MKFARYLEETQTPEWKRAYIDYRGLKKRIAAIRREREGGLVPEHSSGDDPLLSPVNEDNESAASPVEGRDEDDADVEDDASDGEKPVSPQQVVESPVVQAVTILDEHPSTVDVISTATQPLPAASQAQPGYLGRSQSLRAFASKLRLPSFSSPIIGPPPRLAHSSTLPDVRYEQDAMSAGSSRYFRPAFSSENSNVRNPPIARSLRDILPTLTLTQRKFFDKLDSELEKIESFYLDREKDARERSEALRIQLHELRDHRRVFYEAHPPSATWTNALSFFSHRSKTDVQHFQAHTHASAENVRHGRVHGANLARRPPREANHAGSPPEHVREGHNNSTSPQPSSSRSPPPPLLGHFSLQTQFANMMGWAENGGAAPKGKQREKFDPDEYTHAKKKLKKAVLEHYRALELLSDYRILNITGFRKALKKFEKVTKISVQTAYMKEKVENSAFASDDSVKVMIRDTEEQFAARFSRGDKKKAMSRLRGGLNSRHSHHTSSFQSGIFLGLAVPALVDGLIRSFDPDTRALISGWDGLLFVYSLFLVPTLFACLISVNILTWARSRINYVFIFELDVRTALNKHEYAELPLFLLATLMYAFWFSFARVASHTVDPTTWPLIWLLVVAAVMFNPFHVLHRSARVWLLRNGGRLLTSGVRRVEFADFWMGDQYCSLIFTLSNIYFLGCVYAGLPGGEAGTESVHPPRFAFDAKWKRCTTPSPGSKVWAIPIVIATLPLLVRAVQSVKRYVDSKLVTHLINGGKYATGIIYYATYFNWRHNGGQPRGVAFAFWIIFGTLYASYASAWDFLMDWSLFKPHAQYPLLRPNLLYAHTSLYYFAIISNVVIRFIWVIYIPTEGLNFLIRSFIAGSLEMLRRVQWNFIRLENEHLGNMDQYRVTREVPLPYSMDDIGADSGGEEDMDEDAGSSRRSWRSRRSRALAGTNSGIPT